ncbi:MAG TPA: diguanylate cyclase [Spirochaetia bacterium]|nr:diguanylate cyclase [Spirochaetia bacterium]
MHTSEEKNALLQNLLNSAESLDSLMQKQSENESVGAWSAALFDVLFDLQLSEEEATDLLDNVLEHQKLLTGRVGSHIDFRVAALDFFLNRGGVLENPKIMELRGYEGKLRFAVVDELTGLYNRRYLGDALRRELNRSKRYQIPLSVLFLDLDNFKQVNDSYGHQAGDDVLRGFAAFLRHYLRSEDIAARYGGEEFLVVMPQTDLAGALKLGARLLSAVETDPIHSEIHVTFSGGIATYPDHADSVDSLIELADVGLYAAKMAGKNRIDLSGEEKRHDRRFPVQRLADIELHCCKFAGDSYPGTIRNVSRSGISFEGAQPVGTGDSIVLVVHSNADNRDYEILSRVVWSRELEGAARYRVGARYTEPVAEELNRLMAVSSF